MASFRDKQGREWTVAIDGYVLHRARSHGKIDLGAVFAGIAKAGQEGAEGFSVDPALLMELCYYGCESNSRIRSGKVDKEEFLRMLTGQTIGAALQATAEALSECFAPPADKKEAEADSPLAGPEKPAS